MSEPTGPTSPPSTTPQPHCAPPKCPVCAQPLSDQAHVPFCSKRCRRIDLGRWFDGQYTISRPIDQQDLDEGE